MAFEPQLLALVGGVDSSNPNSYYE